MLSAKQVAYETVRALDEKKGVGIKLLISLVLGMFAIVIVLGGDVIRFIVHATRNGVKRNRPEPQVEVC